MNVVWVTPQLPSRRSGGQVRQFNLLRGLLPRHVVTVIALVQPDEHDDVAALRALGAHVASVPFVPPPPRSLWRNRLHAWGQRLFDRRPHYATVYPLDGLRAALRRVTASVPDIVLFEFLFTVPLAAELTDAPWLWTAHNVEWLNLARQTAAAHGLDRVRSRIEVAKLRAWELHWARRSRACVAVSAEDAARLHELAPACAVTVVPNGVDVAAFTPPPGAPPRRDALFLGNLDYAPNQEAVRTLVHDIWPAVRRAHPDARLRLVGGGAPPALRAAVDQPGIDFVGFVDDVRAELWRAAVCIVPLRSGGGTRLKVLEALAARCPLVATPVGVEGIAVRDGEHALLATEAPDLAAAVSRLLADPAAAARRADAGHALAAARYDWSRLVPLLEQAMTTARKAAAR